MKPATILLLAVVLSLAASTALVYLSPPLTSAPPTESPDLIALRAQIGRLTSDISQLDAKVERLAAAPKALDQPISKDAIARAVESWMQAHPASPTAPTEKLAATEAETEHEETAADLDLDSALAKLRDPNVPDEEKQALWEKLRGSTILDGVIAGLQQDAERNPNDPEAQTQFGMACIQKVLTMDEGPAKGAWALKADRAFDRALETDPSQWSARFCKAISLSFWPPIFGKQGEAIDQFEILMKQQESRSSHRSEESQTYLYLGNLYAQQGKIDKAREVWQRGLSLFPDDQELRSKMQ